MRRSSSSISVRRPRLTARNAPERMASYSAVRPAHAMRACFGYTVGKGGIAHWNLVATNRDHPGNDVRLYERLMDIGDEITKSRDQVFSKSGPVARPDTPSAPNDHIRACANVNRRWRRKTAITATGFHLFPVRHPGAVRRSPSTRTFRKCRFDFLNSTERQDIWYHASRKVRTKNIQ